MKNLIFTLFLLVGFVFSSSAQTQAIKVGPLGFLFGNYNLRYEKTLSDQTTFQVGANFYDYNLGEFSTSGFGLDAGWRYYFREAMRGAYVFPSANYDFNNTAVGAGIDEDASFSNLNVGATFGYQWVGSGGFVVDLGLGYGYNIGISQDDRFADDRDLGRGGSVRFTFALGYAF